MASIVTHVADLRTCVLHPASTTHRQMTDEQLAEAGVTPDLIRFSVGIENPEDIIEDVATGTGKGINSIMIGKNLPIPNRYRRFLLSETGYDYIIKLPLPGKTLPGSWWH